MEDDIDIYEDLPSFEAKHGESLTTSNQDEIALEHGELKRQIAELTEKLEDARKVNKTLEVNLSSLLKTAKAEIARKDKMIENLRKELDDASFRRGTYAKTTEHVARKSIRQRNPPTTRYESPDSRPRHNENKCEPMEVDSLIGHSDDRKQQNVASLIPVTVFGERLRKRIADEKQAEQAERQLNKFNTNDNSSESVEGYIAESDKENGSRRNTRILDSKENHSSAEGGPTVRSKTTADLRSVEENEVEAGQRYRSAFVTKCVGKRANDEPSESISVKRLKTAKDEHRIDLTSKREELQAEHNGQESFSKYLSEKKRALKGSNVERVINSSTGTKKHRCFLVEGTRKHDRNDSRERSISTSDTRETRDVNGHASKQRTRSVEKSRFPSDEGNADRSCNSLKRKSYRDTDTAYEDYHRTKRREDYRTDRRTIDLRSRIKSTSYARYREERYERGKFDKHSSHGEKECHDSQNSVKRQTTHRTPDSLEAANRHRKDDRYESRRLRSADRSRKRERRKSENIEETNRESNAEESVGRSKHFEDTRPSVERNEALNAVDTQPSKHLEDGEIPTTPDKSLMKNREEPNIRQSVSSNAIPSPSKDLTKSVVKKSRGDEKLKTLFDSTSESSPVIPNGVPASSNEQRIGNPENNESIENLENIEKFIRDYGSRKGYSEKTSTSGIKIAEDPIIDDNEKQCNNEPVQDFVKTLNEPTLVNDNNEIQTCRKTDISNGELQNELFGVLVEDNRNGETKTEEDSKAENGVDSEGESRLLESVEISKGTMERYDESKGMHLEDILVKEVDPIPKDNGNGDGDADDDGHGNSNDESNDSVDDGNDGGEGDDEDKEEANSTMKSSPENQASNHADKQDQVDKVERTMTQKSGAITGDVKTKVQGKVIVFARRKKPVCLADNNASMTILVNSNNTSSSLADESDVMENNSILKPRACKLSRIYKTT